MNRVVGSIGIGAALFAAATFVGACSTAPIAQPPAPAPVPSPVSSGDIVRRHWDQTCVDGSSAPGPLRVSELFDTLGLGAELTANGLRPPRGAGEGALVEYITRYGADGRIIAQGLWDFTVDSAAAEGVSTVLRGRARTLPRLLQSEGFRTRLVLYPWPRLEMAPTIACMPHPVHREGAPPVGLPDTVRTWSGRRFTLAAGNDSTVAVRIMIDGQGRVIEVIKRRGSERAFEAALAVIGQLQFDPPSRNGEPIVDTLAQSFRFSRSATGYDEATLDSLWLTARGFFRRAEDFPAIGRLFPAEIERSLPLSQSLAAFDGFEVREVDGARVAWVRPGPQRPDCPANIYVNGSPIRTNPTAGPPELDVLAAEFRVTGVEMYAGPATPVADSLGCGMILLWSRDAQSMVDQELVGSIAGVVVWPEGVDVDRSSQATRDRERGLQVMLEPVGRSGYLRNGTFRIDRVLPGRYRLEVHRDGPGLWTDSVTVVANATANVRVELSSR